MSVLAPASRPGPDLVSGCGIDAVIGLGSNLGARLDSLRFACDRLGALGRIVGVSHVYETLPVGPAQPDFLNAAVRLLSSLEPLALLQGLHGIERSAGRERRERWGPRCLDLDLLWMRDRCVDTPDLVVPHPELSHRPFALAPLLDVAPDAADPRTGVPYAELLARLDQTGIGRIAPRAELLTTPF